MEEAVAVEEDVSEELVEDNNLEQSEQQENDPVEEKYASKEDLIHMKAMLEEIARNQRAPPAPPVESSSSKDSSYENIGDDDDFVSVKDIKKIRQADAAALRKELEKERLNRVLSEIRAHPDYKKVMDVADEYCQMNPKMAASFEKNKGDVDANEAMFWAIRHSSIYEKKFGSSSKKTIKQQPRSSPSFVGRSAPPKEGLKSKTPQKMNVTTRKDRLASWRP